MTSGETAEYICIVPHKLSGLMCVYSESDTMAVSTVSALRDASHTAYVRGQWVYTDGSGEAQYRIVEPTLPCSGDYSAYNLWGKFHVILIWYFLCIVDWKYDVFSLYIYMKLFVINHMLFICIQGRDCYWCFVLSIIPSFLHSGCQSGKWWESG